MYINSAAYREKLKAETTKAFVERIKSINDAPILDDEEMAQAYELVKKYNSYDELIEALLIKDFSDFKIGIFIGGLKVRVHTEKSDKLIEGFYNYIKSLEQTGRSRNQAC